MCDVFYDDNINFIFKIPIYFVYLNTVQDGVVMCYMSKTICTETMLTLSNTLTLEYCVNYFVTIEVNVKLGSPFCTMVQKVVIHLLWLLRYDF